MKTNLPIEVDPEIMGGTPVFRGTRVPVPTVRRGDVIELLEKTKQDVLERAMA